mmetsp:Transcript_2534/g.7574  ORF Transcript_2534/g.7574 Transcript_2534/m.7574 type:complete len:227 (-) Transcript_2534:722-1402(-)
MRAQLRRLRRPLRRRLPRRAVRLLLRLQVGVRELRRLRAALELLPGPAEEERQEARGLRRRAGVECSAGEVGRLRPLHRQVLLYRGPDLRAAVDAGRPEAAPRERDPAGRHEGREHRLRRGRPGAARLRHRRHQDAEPGREDPDLRVVGPPGRPRAGAELSRARLRLAALGRPRVRGGAGRGLPLQAGGGRLPGRPARGHHRALDGGRRRPLLPRLARRRVGEEVR